MKRSTFLACVLVVVAASDEARAAPPNNAGREECVEAHSRGQDLKERGQLTRAKQVFLTCAQSTCPALVQADCARFGEELAQIVPTVTFGARDARAADLPLTTVYVDDVLTTSRLDDGRSYELDPGKHVIRFVHEGRESSLKVVVSQGEKGRVLVATFLDPPRATENVDPPIETTRSKLPLFVAGIGGAAAIGGAVLFGVGMASVPGACSVSSKECTAPPGDPSIEQARSSVSLANTGLAIGIAGLVTVAGAMVWYFVQPAADTRRGSATPLSITF